MKKQMIAGACMLASLGAISAQGLYEAGLVNSDRDDLTESLPIQWNAGLSFGYDDNVTPTIVSGPGADDSSALVSAYVGGNWNSVTPQTTWDIYGRVGGSYYFDSPARMSSDAYGEAKLGVNFAHRVSERLRFTSRNYMAYEMEPDYSYGIALDRQVDPYFFWRTDNAVGYRWSERFATYTGFNYTGVNYGSDASGNDRGTFGFYNQFRYSLSLQTVLTLDYRYTSTSSSGLAVDSDSHYLLVGVEHRFNPNVIGLFKAGAQYRDSDSGNDNTSPFVEGVLRAQMNDQFSVRAFVRYGMEDYGTSFGNYYYDLNEAFRLGVSMDYVVSPQLTLHGGLNAIYTNFQDASNLMISDLDQTLWNASIGFSYKISDICYITGSYNYTDSSSNGGAVQARDSREYAQNRASLGIRMEF